MGGVGWRGVPGSHELGVPDERRQRRGVASRLDGRRQAAEVSRCHQGGEIAAQDDEDGERWHSGAHRFAICFSLSRIEFTESKSTATNKESRRQPHCSCRTHSCSCKRLALRCNIDLLLPIRESRCHLQFSASARLSIDCFRFEMHAPIPNYGHDLTVGM